MVAHDAAIGDVGDVSDGLAALVANHGDGVLGRHQDAVDDDDPRSLAGVDDRRCPSVADRLARRLPAADHDHHSPLQPIPHSPDPIRRLPLRRRGMPACRSTSVCGSHSRAWKAMEMVAGGTRLPSGTVTFVFTDIEGSTRLIRSLGDGYAPALDRHREILREAWRRHRGHEVDTEGDSFFVVFGASADAIVACAEGQLRSVPNHGHSMHRCA